MTSPENGRIAVVRAGDRFVSERNGITTWHVFSFGDHYDPDNIRFGPLIAFNDELLAPGAEYADHEHRDVELVTWVLSGTLAHVDSAGHRGLVRPGTVQRLTAGSGVTHRESNAGGSDEALRFVQLWFDLDAQEVEPSYELWTLEDGDDRLGFTVVAGGRTPRRGAHLAVPGVEVSVAHLEPGSSSTLRLWGRTHAATLLYVASGSLEAAGLGRLDAGDTLKAERVTGGGSEDLSLDPFEYSVVILIKLGASC